MNPSRWQHIQDIFSDVVERPREARVDILQQLCGGDLELQTQVQALLDADDEADTQLEHAVEAVAAEALSRSSGPTERIGPYEITGVIGSGGMGTVYCARRADDQLRQTVAIKVLHGVASGGELDRRFRAERQILARLAHPNIARFFDAGITASGAPYLVMEYIEGSTIDVYIRESGVSVPKRIELFRDLCSAVQYAHQNLIIHRDIKPANVMVTSDGVPKLLDFGIAKLLNPEENDPIRPLTRATERLMTPQYASPEQIRGEPVTTASDVYALGMLLYELISGVRPFDTEDLSPTALEKLICDTPPERPSVRRRKLVKAADDRIGTDLDNIVLKALQKDPARRYASAGALSEDLHRYQQDFPVLARPDSWWYRTSRFVSRHRVAAVAVTLSAVVTAGLIVGLVIESQRARQEAATASRVSDFLVSLLQDFSPEQVHGRSVNVRDILDRGSERVPAELSDHPLVEARLFEILGTTYQQFGEFDRAESLLNKARVLYSRSLGPDSREATECLLTLAAIASDRGDFHHSGELYGKAVTNFTLLGDARSEKMARAVEGVGEVRRMLGDLDGAKQSYLQAIELYREVNGPLSPRTLNAKNDLVAVLDNQSDYDGAARLARENVAAEKAALGPDSPQLAFTFNLLAYALGRMARFAEAADYLRQALDIQRKIYGAEHPAIALNLADLSALERELGHYSESEQLAAESLAMSLKLSGPQSLGTANCQGQLGLTELALGNVDNAFDLLDNAFKTRAALGNPKNPDLGDNYDRLGLAYLAMHNLPLAHHAIAQGLEIRKDFYGHNNENVARSLNHLGQVLAAEGKFAAAADRYREAVGISEGIFKTGHTITADGLFGLGCALMSERRFADARAPLSRALAMRRKLLPADHPAVAEAAAALARCSSSMKRS